MKQRCKWGSPASRSVHNDHETDGHASENVKRQEPGGRFGHFIEVGLNLLGIRDPIYNILEDLEMGVGILQGKRIKILAV